MWTKTEVPAERDVQVYSVSKGFPKSAFVIDLSFFLALLYQSTVLSYPMPSLNGIEVSVYTTKL